MGQLGAVEWSAGATSVYLVVLPSPWNPAQSGGTFRVEVARSVAAAGR